MFDDPIPLFDGELSGAGIVHENNARNDAATTAAHCKRAHVRHEYQNSRVCFSLEFDSGKTDAAECPLINISVGGLAIEYDHPLKVGQRGHISYRAVNGKPIHVGCSIRYCGRQPNGHYRLGIKLDRKLLVEETKPAKVSIGREVAPGIRARKLKPLSSENHCI